MAVRAVVGLDPWMMPVLDPLSLRVPTLALLTQSLMFPSNASAIRDTLDALRRKADFPALFVEAAETRHQEMSDMASIFYWSLRATTMAGRLSPAEALRRTLDPTVGFLAAVGALPHAGSEVLEVTLRLEASSLASLACTTPAA